MRNLLYIITTLLFSTVIYGQSAKGATYLGNKNYQDKNYIQAEANYRIANSKGAKENISEYNLANSLYRQNMTHEAVSTYLRTIENLSTKEEKHQAYHNLGNTYLKDKKYKLAEEAFKNALRNNPKDDQTRYNYALAKKLNQENPDQNKDDQNKDDQNKDDQNKDDQNKDDQNKDDQNKDDQNKDDQNKDDQNKDDQNKDDQNKDDQKQPNQEQMERMLEAINQQERNVQQRLLNKDKKDQGQEATATGSGKPKKDW